MRTFTRRARPTRRTVAAAAFGGRSSYLRLDAVQTSEPEDLAPPQLHLGVVDLVRVLRQLLLVDLLLGDAVSGLLQELQVVGGDGGDQLIAPTANKQTNKQTNRHKR